MRNAGYFVKEAFLSISRNRFLSMATVSTVLVSIFILGSALLLVINASNYMDLLESDVEMVAFVDQKLPEDDVKNIGYTIKKIEGVAEVNFISKDQAMKELQGKYTGQGYDLAETLGYNPLPDTYEIKALDPKRVAEMAQAVQDIPGVYKVNYGQGIVEKIFSLTDWIRLLSIVVIGFLLLGSVFLIAISIRLAIFSRRKEIYLMKLIGAKDSFIGWPFFIEGVVLGLVGSIAAVLLLALVYAALVNYWQSLVSFIPLVDSQELLVRYYLGLSGLGMLLGVIGTTISINRFMDV
jgi:cell division transport system permease protein